MTATVHRDYSLDQRWEPGSGPVVLTGVQAIGRMLLEQHRGDQAAGNRVATFVSGYQGSPLAGLDRTLTGIPGLAEHDITVLPGLNEELAATSVWGSQLTLPGARRTHDGVIGVWYGKAPGLDRSGDAIRHANAMGVDPRGGVLALVGDDPGCKSSTLPSASEPMLAALGLPVLAPRHAADIVRLGQYGVALSRASGCWVALKIVADVADGVWTLAEAVRSPAYAVPDLVWQGKPWAYSQETVAMPPASNRAEAALLGPRWAMVEAFTRANPIDEVVWRCDRPTLTIVAAGTASNATRQALAELGVDAQRAAAAGIQLIELVQVHPINASLVADAIGSSGAVLVVEEKGPFVETQVLSALYGSAHAPRIIGKRDAAGEGLIPSDGELTTARLLTPLRRALGELVELGPAPTVRTALSLTPVSRTPYFCSGCPHNRSTVVPEGSLAGGGIGCHAMVAMLPRKASQISSLTQMGGEGAQWIAQARYHDLPHMFQNMGDGTYFHSGQLAVQACVAAGVNITFKILYNDVVAMTGGQDAKGARPVPDLVAKLKAEGVGTVLVLTDQPKKYRKQKLPNGVAVWHRDRLDEAQRMLREVPGVTVLIYDQACAAEARRLRKRNKAAPPATRVIINERVCEGCGDCGAKSNCLSVEPVMTEFGRKTRIDQSSCNTDLSCLDGDCPSFLTVTPGKASRRTQTRPELPVLAPVTARAEAEGGIFLAGIGGTGIVTVNQILATAGLIDGLDVRGLDQTGLSQKAGPVTSHLRYSRLGVEGSNRLSTERATCYLAFDALVGADPKHLGAASPDVTVAVVSTTQRPTGAMVSDVDADGFDAFALRSEIDLASNRMISFDASRVAERLFGSSVSANLLLVGAAYQAGALPFTEAALVEAIRLNGVAVEQNTLAFQWGRVAVSDPAAFQALTPQPAASSTPRFALDDCDITGSVRELVASRAGDLVRYQDAALAKKFVNVVERVWAAERSVTDSTELTEAVARGLHRLMAYKDEYEVAALLGDRDFLATLDDEVAGAHHATYRLHPPMLRSLGMKKKLALSTRYAPALRVLARGKRLRGTKWDLFGYAHVRQVEQKLPEEYADLVFAGIARLASDNHATVVALARTADVVRGYEQIKLDNVERFRAEANALLDTLT